MKNALEIWLTNEHRSPTDAMNKLQDAGIVSDECVTAADVAEKDIPKAIAFLKDNEVLLL